MPKEFRRITAVARNQNITTDTDKDGKAFGGSWMVSYSELIDGLL